MSLDSPYLNLLKNRINLRQIPFSDRASRLLVFQSDDHLTIRLAERWFKLQGQLAAYRERPPLIDHWVFTDGEGNPLEINLTTYPHRLDCATRVGTFSLTFVDAETLLITLPACRCGIKFDANLDNVHPDRRGGVLRLTGDIRRNVAYTTDAHILNDDVRCPRRKKPIRSICCWMRPKETRASCLISRHAWASIAISQTPRQHSSLPSAAGTTGSRPRRLWLTNIGRNTIMPGG